MQCKNKKQLLKHFLLITAALCSVAVAVLHIYIIIQGAWAYRFFGAGETMADMAEQGSYIPVLVTFLIVLAFLGCAVYYLSAAGVLPQLPFRCIFMALIAAVYAIRGAAVFPALLFDVELSSFDIWSSLISFVIGIIHITGFWLYWIDRRI